MMLAGRVEVDQTGTRSLQSAVPRDVLERAPSDDERDEDEYLFAPRISILDGVHAMNIASGCAFDVRLQSFVSSSRSQASVANRSLPWSVLFLQHAGRTSPPRFVPQDHITQDICRDPDSRDELCGRTSPSTARDSIFSSRNLQGGQQSPIWSCVDKVRPNHFASQHCILTCIMRRTPTPDKLRDVKYTVVLSCVREPAAQDVASELTTNRSGGMRCPKRAE